MTEKQMEDLERLKEQMEKYELAKPLKLYDEEIIFNIITCAIMSGDSWINEAEHQVVSGLKGMGLIDLVTDEEIEWLINKTLARNLQMSNSKVAFIELLPHQIKMMEVREIKNPIIFIGEKRSNKIQLGWLDLMGYEIREKENNDD